MMKMMTLKKLEALWVDGMLLKSTWKVRSVILSPFFEVWMNVSFRKFN